MSTFVSAFSAIKALGPIDRRSIGRDSLLRWMLFMPLFLALLIRFGLPWLVAGLEESLGFDLTPYIPLIYSYIVVVNPTLLGFVIGFLLLDERDDDTLTALQVTPLPLNSYLVYRLGLPGILSIILLPVTLLLSGVNSLNLAQMLLLAILAAPIAPMFMLFLAAFAENKVQGFAYSKGLGTVPAAPLIAWFVDPPLEYVFGIFPPYWAMKAFWVMAAGESGVWIVFIVGMIYQIGLTYLLLRRFHKVMYR
jgi:fluoroquinolone transport system permease protein